MQKHFYGYKAQPRTNLKNPLICLVFIIYKKIEKSSTLLAPPSARISNLCFCSSSHRVNSPTTTPAGSKGKQKIMNTCKSPSMIVMKTQDELPSVFAYFARHGERCSRFVCAMGATECKRFYNVCMATNLTYMYVSVCM